MQNDEIKKKIKIVRKLREKIESTYVNSTNSPLMT